MEFKADPGEDVDTDPPNVPWPAPPVDAPPPPPRRADTVDSGLLSLTPEGQGVGVDDEDRLLDAEGDVGVAYREALRAATAVPLRGLPRVLVKWEGVENATPKSLYATDWVPLGLVSAAADPGIPQPPPKPSPRGGRTPTAALASIGEDKDAALSAAGNRRRQLAEYLEAQIELAASLCDGRNSFCIAKLQVTRRHSHHHHRHRLLHHHLLLLLHHHPSSPRTPPSTRRRGSSSRRWKRSAATSRAASRSSTPASTTARSTRR
jgi:hypothetical protein